MFQIFLKFSGILAMFVAWIFVVGPAMHHGIDSKSQTITLATVENKKVLKIVGFGLIAGAILQGIFLFYIIQKYHVPFFSIGSLMYLSSNIATIMVAIFHFDKFPKFHEAFARYYFVVSPLSLGFIGYSVMKLNPHLFFFSILTVIFYFTGSLIIMKKINTENALLEFWAFFTLSIWTVVFSIV